MTRQECIQLDKGWTYIKNLHTDNCYKYLDGRLFDITPTVIDGRKAYTIKTIATPSLDDLVMNDFVLVYSKNDIHLPIDFDTTYKIINIDMAMDKEIVFNQINMELANERKFLQRFGDTPMYFNQSTGHIETTIYNTDEAMSTAGQWVKQIIDEYNKKLGIS